MKRIGKNVQTILMRWGFVNNVFAMVAYFNSERQFTQLSNWSGNAEQLLNNSQLNIFLLNKVMADSEVEQPNNTTTRPQKNPKRVAAGKALTQKKKQAREVQKKLQKPLQTLTLLLAKKLAPRKQPRVPEAVDETAKEQRFHIKRQNTYTVKNSSDFVHELKQYYIANN